MMSLKSRETVICGYKHSVLVCNPGNIDTSVEWLESIVNFLRYRNKDTNNSDLKIFTCINKLPRSFPESWFSFHNGFHNRLVFIVRHPKDVAAASYSAEVGSHEKELSDFLEEFVSNRSQITWFDHTLQWGEFLKSLPTEMVQIVYFESLVHNLRGELENICRFLGLPWDDNSLDKCCTSLSLDEYIHNDGPQRKRQRTDVKDRMSHVSITYEIGTWKRLFMVGQSERFDEFLKAKMNNSAINIEMYL